MDIAAVTDALNALAEDTDGVRWWTIKHNLPPAEKAFVEAIESLIDRRVEAAGNQIRDETSERYGG